jgi:hypothetical protein
MRREAAAPVAGLVELVTLYHGAHGPIENQDMLFKRVRQGHNTLRATGIWIRFR